MSCRLRRPSKIHHLEKPQNPDHTEFIASVFMEKYRKDNLKRKQHQQQKQQKLAHEYKPQLHVTSIIKIL